MQEIIEQLKTILKDAFEHIERHLEIEQIDLKEFDKTLDDREVIDGIGINHQEYMQRMLKFREVIVRFKEDNSFWGRAFLILSHCWIHQKKDFKIIGPIYQKLVARIYRTRI